MFGGFDAGLGEGEGAGGAVRAVRYAKSLSHHSSARQASSAGEALFGVKIPQEASEAMQIVLMAMGGLLLIALLFARQLELRPRYRHWRGRWTRRR